MTAMQGARTPLSLIGWPLVVVPVVYTIFSGLYGQFTDEVPYFGGYFDLACVVLGGALLALGGSRFAGALAAAIGTALLTLTGLVAVVEVAIRADPEYVTAVWYVNVILLVLAGIAVTVGLVLLASRWRTPRQAPGYGPFPGHQPGYPQQPGFPPQGMPQQPGYPQPPQSPPPGQPYPQPGYPQQPPYGQRPGGPAQPGP